MTRAVFIQRAVLASLACEPGQEPGGKAMTMNKNAKQAAARAYETIPTNVLTARTLAKAGLSPTRDELEEMRRGLRRRDYEEILFEIARLTTPVNRRDRRARASVNRRVEHGLEQAVERMLPAYEAILASMSNAEKEALAKAEEERHPHPDGRYAPSALDTKAIADLKRSAWEMQILFRAHNRRARRMRAILAAQREAA